MHRSAAMARDELSTVYRPRQQSGVHLVKHFFSLSLTFQGLVLDNLLKPGLLFLEGRAKKGIYLSFKTYQGQTLWLIY